MNPNENKQKPDNRTPQERADALLAELLKAPKEKSRFSVSQKFLQAARFIALL